VSTARGPPRVLDAGRSPPRIGRLYWEYSGRSVTGAGTERTAEISLPVAITVFPGAIYRAPETWARRAYRNLISFNEVDKGGHFAAWEQPELFAAELRAAFRQLRQAP
jgi:pimeloyl-ACP methyl ester carboxylesterase